MDSTVDKLGLLQLEPTHPLLIDKIFTNITKYLTFPELVKSTEVCKTWCAMAKQILLERKPLSIFYNLNNTFPPSLTEVLSISPLLMARVEFNEQEQAEIFGLLDHPKTQHLSKIVIRDCILSKEVFHTLLQKHGHKLQELEVEILHSPPGEWRPATEAWCPFPIPAVKANGNTNFSAGEAGDNLSAGKIDDIVVLPNLRSFLFTCSDINATCNFHGVGLSLPNLVELKIYGKTIPFDAKTPEVKLNLLMLKKLMVGLPIASSINWDWNKLITYFMDNDLKLVDLEFLNIYGMESLNIITKFVETQANTLQKLTMRITDADFSGATKELDMPKLLKLKQLILDEIYIQNIGKPLTSTPNIEELHIIIRPNSLEPWKKLLPPSDFNPIQSLKTLVLIDDVGEVGYNQFGVLCKLFPAIEDLTLQFGFCNDELLSTVFSELSELKKLAICGEDMTDSGFLGITMEDCIKLREGTLSQLELELVKTSSPSIRDLEKLERLSIKCLDGPDEVLVTDLTFLYGIFELPNLKYVFTLGVKETSQIEDGFMGKGFQQIDVEHKKFAAPTPTFKYIKNT